MTEIELVGCYQDGADFYTEEGEHIVSFPGRIANDWDMEGARLVRQLFARLYPDKVIHLNKKEVGA